MRRRNEREERVASNYERYIAAAFNRPEHYPIGPTPDSERYVPLGPWMGRLILPANNEREAVLGCWIELQHTPAEHAALMGQHARLRWAASLDRNARFWGATRSVHFNDQAHEALQNGIVVGERLDGREHVNPFESLAGAHPIDDICVRLEGPVTVDLHPADGGAPIVYVQREPAQITGRFVALVRFEGPIGSGDSYRVRHFNRASRAFDGPEELLALPEVLPDGNGTRNSTRAGIERSPLNAEGWYCYGALDGQGQFVVQALAPRRLLRLEPQLFCDRTEECMSYLKPRAWRKDAVKGAATTALLCGDGVTPHDARASWGEGDQALLLHLFGGIGGENPEPAARTPLYWGHMAFGEARVVRDPLSDELVFDIVYHQIYAHNTDGLTSGALHYSRYSGDRQFGWLGVRPIQDVLIRIDGITGNFAFERFAVSALDYIVGEFEVMAARYRIADGRGATRVGAVNNCAQDSSQALYSAIRGLERMLDGQGGVAAALKRSPGGESRLAQLRELAEELRAVLLPWGSARDDWEYGAAVLGGVDEGLLSTVGKAVNSWRTMLPPVAARAIVEVFLEHGASAWVLRSYQAGGDDPTIAPFVPNV